MDSGVALSLTIDGSSEHRLTLTSEGVRTLLARPDLSLFMVDSWATDERYRASADPREPGRLPLILTAREARHGVRRRLGGEPGCRRGADAPWHLPW